MICGGMSGFGLGLRLKAEGFKRFSKTSAVNGFPCTAKQNATQYG